MFRVLHLSDLHIGGTYLKSQDLAYKITNDIARTGIKGIRSVLVTGDIFHGPAGHRESLIQEAVEFFRTLISELNENKSADNILATDVLFVPGNHDMVWSDDLGERWSKYRSFLDLFYGTLPTWYDNDEFSFMRTYDEQKIVFLGFNSCGLEKRTQHDEGVQLCEKIEEEKYRNFGIDKTSVLNLLEAENPCSYEDYGEISMRQLAIQRRKVNNLSEYQTIALFHHHFFLFPDIANQLGDADVLRNHPTMVRDLQSMGVKTILHGHKHFDLERPFINDDYYETTDSIIDVFAGGSAGANQGLQRHSFSIIEFYSRKDPVKLRQLKFVYKEDALEPIKTIQIPPASRSAHVVKLIDLVKTRDNDAFEEYEKIIMSNNHLYRTCCSIIDWTGSVLTGYSETYRYLNGENENVICLLYAIACRAISYIIQHSPGEKNGLTEIKNTLAESFVKKLGKQLPDGYMELFDYYGLNQIAKHGNGILERTSDYVSRQYIALTMMAVFITDLNLVFTEYADDFYRQISHKVNVKLEPNQFHHHVPAPRIEIQADSDRRSAYVKMWCNNATAHKLAVLFVKEFDLAINKFEDFFKIVDFKLYYLLPKIEKDPTVDTLDNYNFEAYIPTLLPLLIGENIYRVKQVFARELIQNAIDAISVREAVEGTLDAKDKIIHIELARNEDGQRFFRITDHGTGMDRYKVERYFTSIGRSFYSGDDYSELNIGYKPISSFGIGFLSSFLVCNEIDVRTRSFDGDQEQLKLHIPNYEGCFFIERTNNVAIGTEITLYLHEAITDKQIIQYIESSMLDIEYEIVIESQRSKRLTIPAHAIRENRQESTMQMFVPLSENGGVEDIDWENEVLTGSFATTRKYGILINLNSEEKNKFHILNAGIDISLKILRPLLGKEIENFLNRRPENKYIDKREMLCNAYSFNFPSNWIQLDVSREKIVGFSSWMKDMYVDGDAPKFVLSKMGENLNRQALSLLNYAKQNEVNVPAKCIAELGDFIATFQSKIGKETKKWEEDLRYTVNVTCTDFGIEFALLRNQRSNKVLSIYCEGEEARKQMDKLGRIIFEKKIYIDGKQMVAKKGNEYIISRKMSPIFHIQTSDPFARLAYAEWKSRDDEIPYLMGCLMALVYSESVGGTFRDREKAVEESIIRTLLGRMSISKVERGEAKMFVSYEAMFDFGNKNGNID